MADGYYFKMVCFYGLTSPVFFVLVKEAVVGSYSLYQFHESSVGKELFSRFLLREEEEGRRREEEEGRRRGEEGRRGGMKGGKRGGGKTTKFSNVCDMLLPM